MHISDKPIVIVGAGAAGLSAAQELLKQGLPVRLLEADNRYGGRVKAVDVGLANPLDTGAAFIHSKSLNLYAHASAQGLLQNKYPSRCLAGGKCLPMWLFGLRYAVLNLTRMNRLYKAFYQWDGAGTTLNELVEMVQFPQVFVGFLRSTLSSSLATGLENVGVVSLRETFKEAGMRPERDIGQYALKDSLYGLLTSLFSEAIAVCEFNRQVISINYAKEPVVETHDGERILASQVILSVPLSILQTAKIQFHPALPASKQQAIARLGMGQGGRIFFRLNRAYWPLGTKQIINSNMPLHLTIHSDNPALLSAFYITTDGRPVDDKEMYELCIHTLTSYFGSESIKSIVAVHSENWSSNALIGGVYSYDPPHSVGARSALATALSSRLFFAGEATAEGHFATVDGAILSGQRAAKEVLNCLC